MNAERHRAILDRFDALKPPPFEIVPPLDGTYWLDGWGFEYEDGVVVRMYPRVPALKDTQ